jgi:hypothetical protein
MTMYGTAPTWHTGWILPTAVTVILLASVIAGVVLALWYLTSPPPGSGADPTVGLPGGVEEVLVAKLTTLNTSGVSRRCIKMVERHAF